jgi:hypothetical protein
MGLSFNIYRHARLEFHGEFILVDGDFLNQPPDKRLVVFRQGSGLQNIHSTVSVGNVIDFHDAIPPDNSRTS